MQPYRLGLAGLGTVGGGLVQLLAAQGTTLAARAGRPIELVAVSARDRAKAAALPLGAAAWVENALDLAGRPDVDAVVELIGGSEGIALDLGRQALAAGKSLVTANKAMLAAHGKELALAAEEKGVALMFEAAVGGGIPVIKALREALAGNKILSVRGILNGTCNYILTRMSREGLAFQEVLADAQRLGYAEADPAADIEGRDAANKLALLAALAFAVAPDLGAVTVEGIKSITPLDFAFARELGCRIKLLGVARPTPEGLEQRVEPCLVPEASSLAAVEGVLNAVQIEGDFVGPLTLEGRGAGGAATASAVASDLVDLARGHCFPAFSVPATHLERVVALGADARKGSWYIRLHVTDRAGVLAEIAGAAAQEAISMETVLQRGRAAKDEAVPLMLLTHETDEAALCRLLERLERLEPVRGRPFKMRLEQAET